MKLIVGLGNFGQEYKNTRHNIGFMVIDKYANKLDCMDEFKEKFKGEYARVKLFNEDVLLFKPLTYMNLSGLAIKEIANFFKIAHEDILVIYDDKDIPFASVRIREKGNPGSHNGMKNITQELNDTNFKRIRIGIGSPIPGQDMASFVLSRFKEDELKELDKSFNNVIAACDLFIQNKFNMAMNKYNSGKN